MPRHRWASGMVVRKLPPCSRIAQASRVTPTTPRYMTISAVVNCPDASLTHTPITANMKLANSIHSDCIEIRSVGSAWGMAGRPGQRDAAKKAGRDRSEEHTSELQSHSD